jgi:hypothetical protein
MDYNFEIWQKALDDFKASVSKDLEEIRQHKEEVQQLKTELYTAMNKGYYLRDDHRVVISAPEIIIGDVDQDGTLLADGSSHVVIRANHVDLDGVGPGGQVNTNAPSIRQTAVDPGIDGMEAVVGPLSEIVQQASSIMLEGDNAVGAFSQTPHSAGAGSVSIHADGNLVVEACVSSEIQKKNLEQLLSSLETRKSAVEKDVADGIKAFGGLVKSVKAIYDKQDSTLLLNMNVRTDVDKLYNLGESMQSLAPSLYDCYQNCSKAISQLAELNRQITCLKEEKNGIKSGDDFKNNPTGATVAIKGEQISITSQDGDGNLRDNEGSGVSVVANEVTVAAVEHEGKLKEKGKFSVNAQTVELSTASATDLKYDDKRKLESGNYAAVGDVVIKSKNITMETVDYEYKDQKLSEKALTKDGTFKLRAEKMDISATDTEGKATGSISINGKAISVRSMDVEKEKRTDDKLAAGSTMLLLSEKMFLGAKSKDIKSKKIQAVTEEMGLFADKTLEAQQGEQKAVIQLADGKASVGGDKTQVYGETTINAKTEIKDELKAPKATIDSVEAKSAFKSPNISDGMAAGGGGGGGNLSAKLKAEDAPKEESAS